MIKSGCTRQCVSIPGDKEYCICEVVDNQRSSDLFQPLRQPETTRHFVGLHVKHKDPNRPQYITLKPQITAIIAAREKEFRVPPPVGDKNKVWNVYTQFKPPPTETRSPIMRNKIYVRPYMAEMQYIEHSRQYHGRDYFKNIDDPCPPKTQEEKQKKLEQMGNITQHWTDFYANKAIWVGEPPAYAKLTDEERKERLFRCDPGYKSTAITWYKKYYETPNKPPNVPITFKSRIGGN